MPIPADYVVFYDEDARPVAWMVEDMYWSIYLYDGTPVARLVDDAVYTYAGRYLGWMQDGWVWDKSGFASLFTDEAQEASGAGLERPRFRSERKPRPPLGPCEPRPARPARTSMWGSTTGVAFFRQ